MVLHELLVARAEVTDEIALREVMASAERRVYVVRGALGRSAVAGRVIAMIAISETCIFDEQAKEYVLMNKKLYV